jgi:hypothetical protein
MTDKVEKKDHKISEVVLEMAKKIEEASSVDKNTGIVQTEDNVYEKLLPEDLTIETVNAVTNHNANFIAAGSYAIGNMAVAAMSKKKDLDQVTGLVKMGGSDTLNVNVERRKEYTTKLKGEPQTTVKFGVVTASYDVTGSHNSGQLKKVRTAIAEMAMEALSSAK